MDGAAAVVDLLAFDAGDTDALLQAVAAADAPPGHLVFVSSVAELDRPRPGAPAGPDGAYGRGKRAARRRYEAGFPGTVHTLVLPRLVAEVDPGLRDRPYLESAAGGRVLVAGDGSQRRPWPRWSGSPRSSAAWSTTRTPCPRGRWWWARRRR